MQKCHFNSRNDLKVTWDNIPGDSLNWSKIFHQVWQWSCLLLNKGAALMPQYTHGSSVRHPDARVSSIPANPSTFSNAGAFSRPTFHQETLFAWIMPSSEVHWQWQLKSVHKTQMVVDISSNHLPMHRLLIAHGFTQIRVGPNKLPRVSRQSEANRRPRRAQNQGPWVV